MASLAAPAVPSAPLTLAQIAILAAYGAVLWFLAALLIRAIGPMGSLDAGSRALTYALVVPGTLPCVLLARRIAGLARRQLAAGMAAATAAAALLDGIALAWFPALYGNEPLAGAVILWGAGVGLVMGVVMSRGD